VAGERITLTWANPQKVVAIGASANPMAPPAFGFRGYYLDQALPREEWERIAAGEESDAFKRWAEMSARFARGELPVIAPPDGVALQEGESVHHLTRPAWLSLSGDPIGGMELQPGTLVVTSRRLLFLTDGPPYFLAWSRVGHLTESPPAVLVHELGTAEPMVFYLHPLDPAYGAMTGAWMRVRSQT